MNPGSLEISSEGVDVERTARQGWCSNDGDPDRAFHESDKHLLKQTIATRSVAAVSSSNWSSSSLIRGFGSFIAPFAMKGC
jgi:hypothetical protein